MPERMEVQVSPGKEDDLAALTNIYNPYVRETPITFDFAPITPDECRPWLLSHPEDGPHSLLIARPPGLSDRIPGHAASSPFHVKAAYALCQVGRGKHLPGTRRGRPWYRHIALQAAFRGA